MPIYLGPISASKVEEHKRLRSALLQMAYERAYASERHPRPMPALGDDWNTEKLQYVFGLRPATMVETHARLLILIAGVFGFGVGVTVTLVTVLSFVCSGL